MKISDKSNRKQNLPSIQPPVGYTNHIQSPLQNVKHRRPLAKNKNTTPRPAKHREKFGQYLCHMHKQLYTYSQYNKQNKRISCFQNSAYNNKNRKKLKTFKSYPTFSRKHNMFIRKSFLRISITIVKQKLQ